MLPPVLCTLIVTFGAPLAVMWLAKRSRGLRQLGFVVVCYVAGAAVRNFAGDCVDGEIADHVSKTTILLAVPLLLFSLDFRGWLKSTTKASLSLLTAIAAVVVSAAVAALISDHRIDEPWKLAGMFSAVYIGGTANMGAVGVALDVKRETFLLANASDIILCAPYWLFLITVGPRIVARWLGERTAAMTETPPFGHDAQDGAALGRVPKPALVGAVALAAAIGAAGAAAAWMLTGRLSTAPGVLVVTTGGLAFSAVPRIRAIRGTGEAGHYLLLVFCVALGMTVDLSGTFQEGRSVMLFNAFVLYVALALHFILARALKIDTETTLITSTATVFGPPFIAPMAAVLRSRGALATGLGASLVGLAVANYVGLAVAYLLR